MVNALLTSSSVMSTSRNLWTSMKASTSSCSWYSDFATKSQMSLMFEMNLMKESTRPSTLKMMQAVRTLQQQHFLMIAIFTWFIFWTWSRLRPGCVTTVMSGAAPLKWLTPNVAKYSEQNSTTFACCLQVSAQTRPKLALLFPPRPRPLKPTRDTGDPSELVFTWCWVFAQAPEFELRFLILDILYFRQNG